MYGLAYEYNHPVYNRCTLFQNGTYTKRTMGNLFWQKRYLVREIYIRYYEEIDYLNLGGTYYEIK